MNTAQMCSHTVTPAAVKVANYKYSKLTLYLILMSQMALLQEPSLLPPKFVPDRLPGRARVCNWLIHATELDIKFELTELGASCLPYSKIQVHQATVTL